MAGSRIKGITVEIGGDTTGLEKALKNVNTSIKDTQSKLKDVQRLLKLDPSNTELVTQKQKLLKEAIASTSEKLETLKEAQRQAKELLENGELGRDKYDALQREIIETEEELRKLQKEAEATNAILEKLGRLGTSLENAGQAITNAGKKAMVASAAVVGIGTAAVKTTAEFDSSMSKVAAISGATGDDLDALRTKAREMGAATKFSASEAADAMTYMAMAGWKTDDMLGGIEGIMNLAAASGEDLATTSDIVTDALTAFGLQASDSTHFADVLAAASSNSNTNVAMMGETFKYCAPIAGALGYSVEDCAEMIGLMANAGIKSTQAGTAMRTIMTKLQGKLKLSGKAFGKVRIATTNADGSMREMGEIIGDLRGYFSQMTESEKAAAAQSLVGKNAMSGFLALMNAAPEDVEKLNSSIAGCDGAAAHMAEVMQDNLSGQLTILKSKLQELAISFGEILMPVIRKVITFIQGLIDKLNNMDEATKERIVRIAAIIAAIGPLLLILGKLLTVLGGGLKGFVSIAKGIGKMKAAAKAGTGVIGKLLGAFGGSVAGLLAVVAAIAALVLAFRHLWNTNEGFRERMTTIWDGIRQKVSSFCSAITERINALGFDFADITEVLKTIWDRFCQVLAPVFEGAFRSISIILSTVLDALLVLFDVFVAIFSGNWEEAWEGIKKFFRTIWDGIGQFFENKWETIKSVLSTVLAWFGLTWEEAWTAVKTFFTNTWTSISTFFSETLNTICTTASAVWTNVKEYAVSAWNGINTTVSTIAKKTAEKISTAFESLKTAVGTLLSSLGSIVSAAWTSFKETISNAWSKFTSSVSTAFSNFVTAAGTLLEPIVTTVAGIWEDMKTAIGTKFTEIVQVLSSAWEALKQGIASAWTAFTMRISETLGPYITTFAELIAPFVEKVKELWESIKTTVSQKWQQLKESISLGWEAFKESVASVLAAYVTTIATLLAPFVEAVTTLWENIKTAISTKWSEVKAAIALAWTNFMTSVSTALTAFVTSFTTLLEPFVTAAGTAWENVKTAISTKVDEIVTAVTTVFTNLDTSLSTAFEAIKTTAETVWEKIKTAITTPIEDAKTFISEAIGAIETFFSNCKLEFPKIKLPHFSITGGFSLNPPSVPHISISWYRKGGILTDPTIFGINGMNLMAGGEAGPEAILPLKPFYDKLESLLEKGQRENVINIYPQNLTEAQIDYLYTRFNARLGGGRA